MRQRGQFARRACRGSEDQCVYAVHAAVAVGFGAPYGRWCIGVVVGVILEIAEARSNNEDVPPHLFATASDGEADVPLHRCKGTRYSQPCLPILD